MEKLICEELKTNEITLTIKQWKIVNIQSNTCYEFYNHI